MNRRPALLLVCAIAPLLAACAGEKSTFPSLARRPVERLSAAPAPPAPPAATAPAAPDPALLARLDSLLDKARQADARFHAHEAEVSARVAEAQGTPTASEAWSVATAALADLQGARSEAMIALADIDEIHAREVVDKDTSGPVATARETVAALIAQEDAVINALAAKLER